MSLNWRNICGPKMLEIKANWQMILVLSPFSYLLKASLYFVSEKSMSTHVTPVNKIFEFSGYRQISPCNSLVLVDFSPAAFFTASVRCDKCDKEAKKNAL